MNDFYVKEIRATGDGLEDSFVEFQPGVNIIHGPSNTGKTYVVMCIDYMLGADNPPMDKASSGIDTISMTLENPDGDTFYAERKVLKAEEGSKADTTITIRTSLDCIENGVWRVKGSPGQESYNSTVLPRLLGVEEPVQIISTQQLRKQQFTFRTFVHQMFLDEEHIFTTKTIIDNPKHPSITASINALSFLLTGHADDGEQIETVEMKRAKKGAVVKYIRHVMENFEHRQAELQEELEKMGGEDIEERMSEILAEIGEVDALMAEVNRQMRDLQITITSDVEDLEETSVLLDRYRMLRSQYEADVERLMFIAEGDAHDAATYVEKCPFCDHEIEREEDRASYAESSRAELEKTRRRLEDLESAEAEAAELVSELESSIAELKAQRESLAARINREYRPKSLELHDALGAYRRVIELRRELDLMVSQLEVLSQDIDETENEDESQEKYDAKKHFDEILFTHLSEAVSEAIKDCAYPGFKTAKISKQSFDILVNNKPKKSEGKGYRAYLNTIYAFTLMKFIEANGVHRPRMLILDSPSLSLTENSEVLIDSSMKSALYRHMLRDCGGCQVIIAENEIPTGVDYDGARLIHFTMSDEGRYGFLRHVRNGDMIEDPEPEGEES